MLPLKTCYSETLLSPLTLETPVSENASCYQTQPKGVLICPPAVNPLLPLWREYPLGLQIKHGWSIHKIITCTGPDPTILTHLLEPSDPKCSVKAVLHLYLIYGGQSFFSWFKGPSQQKNRKRHTYCDFKQIVPFYSSLLVQHLHSPLLNMLPFILSRPSSASWRWDCVSLLELVEPDYWPGDSEIGTNCGENKDHPARHLPQLRSLQSLQAKAACFPLAGGKAILVSVRMIQRNL